MLVIKNIYIISQYQSMVLKVYTGSHQHKEYPVIVQLPGCLVLWHLIIGLFESEFSLTVYQPLWVIQCEERRQIQSKLCGF